MCLECDAFDTRTADPLSEELLWAVDCVPLKNRLPLFAADNAKLYGTAGRGLIGERVP